MARQKWFLREWREHRGLSQSKLADRLGTHRSSINRLEKADARYNQDLLERLAEALDCEPADLLMRNPLAPDPYSSIFDTVRRIPLEDLRRAQAVIEVFAVKPARTAHQNSPTAVKPRRIRVRRRAGA